MRKVYCSASTRATLNGRRRPNRASIDLHIGLPIIIEEMDNSIDEAYGAAPERLYVVDVHGKVAYHGGAGPHFFDLDEWEQAIRACAAIPINSR